MKQKIAVFVSGSGSNLQRLIDASLSGEIENASIELVVGSKANIYAFERAKNHGIEHVLMRKKDFNSEAEFSSHLIELLRSRKIDLIVLAGYLSIVSEDLVGEFEGRILNIHPALIPSFCGKGFYGLHVHEAVYKSGVKVTGATVHFVDGGVDSGPILLQETCPVELGDTPEMIQEKVLKIEHAILPRAVNAYIKGEIHFESGRVFIKK